MHEPPILAFSQPVQDSSLPHGVDTEAYKPTYLDYGLPVWYDELQTISQAVQ